MNKDISEMNINEKIYALQGVLAKALLDTEYSIKCVLGSDKMMTIARMNIVLDNAKALFIEGRVNQLDLDIRNKTLALYNAQLDDCLTKFPEYNKEEENELSGRSR